MELFIVGAAAGAFIAGCWAAFVVYFHLLPLPDTPSDDYNEGYRNGYSDATYTVGQQLPRETD